MKKVIDGKVYNTDTADLIASYNNGMSRRDFGWCEEDLYKTKKGAWFVHGEGGAASRWAEQVRKNEFRGGEGIEMLSEIDARTWCETHGVDADTITEYFPVEEA